MDAIDAGALERRALAVARTLDPDAEPVRIDPALADTAEFCAHYGYSLEESANCIVVRSKTGELRYAACLVQATRRLDLNRHSRLLVGARKASFAAPEETLERTGMIPGGVTPVGLPADMPIFVDAPIMDLDRIIVGGGGRSLKLRLSAKALLAIDQLTVADIGRPAPA